MTINITKLVQDARIKAIEVVGTSICIVYDEPIDVHEASAICEEYEELLATFTSDYMLILEVCDDVKN